MFSFRRLHKGEEMLKVGHKEAKACIFEGNSEGRELNVQHNMLSGFHSFKYIKVPIEIRVTNFMKNFLLNIKYHS